MLLRHIEVRGLRGADGWRADDLGAIADLPAPPIGIGVGDALSVLVATLDGARFAAEGERLGLPAAPDVLLAGGPLDQVTWTTPAPRLDVDGKIGVEIGIELDPPAYASLREHAARDPRLAMALAEGSLVRIKVGWLFSKDRTAMSAAIHQLRVGDSDLAAAGADRPAWVPGFLAVVASRIGRVAWGAEGLAERLHAASLSPSGDVRGRFRALAAAFADAPFGWGALELVRGTAGLELAFGADLVPLRQRGPDAAAVVALVEAMWLGAPDILVVDRPVPGAVRDWLVTRIEADDATIEQALLVGDGW